PGVRVRGAGAVEPAPGVALVPVGSVSGRSGAQAGGSRGRPAAAGAEYVARSGAADRRVGGAVGFRGANAGQTARWGASRTAQGVRLGRVAKLVDAWDLKSRGRQLR